MKMLRFIGVTLLTLSAASLLTACSLINEHDPEVCNSRAYVRSILADHLSSRFEMNAPVRMAIIPLSVPANVSAWSDERPGLGKELAWKLQTEFLGTGQIPIVEVFNRPDWPGKAEEFFTGNFGAISLAREAGYDLVFVGVLESMSEAKSWTASTKIIETESGLTLWYGKTTVSTTRPGWTQELLATKDPSQTYFHNLEEMLPQCIVEAVLMEKEVPE